MVSNQGLAPFPVSTASYAAPAVGFNAEFDARWAAWVARGRVHHVVHRMAVATAFATARPTFNGRFTPLSIWSPRESTRDPS